jgi:hypothetical protein
VFIEQTLRNVLGLMDGFIYYFWGWGRYWGFSLGGVFGGCVFGGGGYCFIPFPFTIFLVMFPFLS